MSFLKVITTYLFVFTLLCHAAFAVDQVVKIQLNFTPAGTFELVSKKLRGYVIRKDNKITSEKLQVRIKTFSSGIDLRDQHFWKHMNFKEHPKAVLTELKGEAGKATGMLEVNGIKKPVIISYTETKTEFEAKMKIKASDYSLPQKSFLGITVEDEVLIEASGNVVQK